MVLLKPLLQGRLRGRTGRREGAVDIHIMLGRVVHHNQRRYGDMPQ
jgi:hypothetical protein